MATFSAIFVPDTKADASSTVTAGASSAEIVIGSNKKFNINANGDLNIAFGVSGMGAATATNFRLPSGVVGTYDTGRNSDRIRLFNNTAGTVTYWIQVEGN